MFWYYNTPPIGPFWTNYWTYLFKFKVRYIILIYMLSLGFPSGSDGKESACSVGDWGLIPGSGRSPGGGNGYPSSILAWRIPKMEEPGRLQSTGSQRVGHDWATLLSLSCNLNWHEKNYKIYKLRSEIHSYIFLIRRLELTLLFNNQ